MEWIGNANIGADETEILMNKRPCSLVAGRTQGSVSRSRSASRAGPNPAYRRLSQSGNFGRGAWSWRSGRLTSSHGQPCRELHGLLPLWETLVETQTSFVGHLLLRSVIHEFGSNGLMAFVSRLTWNPPLFVFSFDRDHDQGKYKTHPASSRDSLSFSSPSSALIFRFIITPALARSAHQPLHQNGSQHSPRRHLCH